MAEKLGDPTARMMGRLTLNPIPHIDPMGLAVFGLTSLTGSFVFGWAKPVPVNPRYFRKIDRDMMLVALAGLPPISCWPSFLAFCSGRRSHFCPLPSGRTIPPIFLPLLPAGRRNHQFRPGLAQFAAHSAAGRQQDPGLFFAAPVCLALYGGGPLRLHNSPDIALYRHIEQDSRASRFRLQRGPFAAARLLIFRIFPFMKFQGLENVRQTTHSIGHAANGPIASWPLFRRHQELDRTAGQRGGLFFRGRLACPDQRLRGYLKAAPEYSRHGSGLGGGRP